MIGKCSEGVNQAPLLHLSQQEITNYMTDSNKHCVTCICGKRAPVQSDEGIRGYKGKQLRGPGSIAWSEHLLAYSAYSAKYGRSQSAERLAERGGFGYNELCELLGHAPTTWEPR